MMVSFSSFCFTAIITITAVSSQDVGILFHNQLIPGNGLIRINEIGIAADAVICMTNKTKCCRSVDTGIAGLGTWEFPDGTGVVGLQATPQETGFYRARNLRQVLLNRRNNASSPTGIFRCIVPDSNDKLLNFDIGVYSEVVNGAVMDPINFMLESTPEEVVPRFNLSCLSRGGPINSAVWTRNGAPLSTPTSPVLENRELAVYTLSLSDSTPGNYSCVFFLRDGSSTDLRMITSNYTLRAVTPPTDVEASMNQSGSIFVTWMQPTSQSPSVSGYRLFYTDGGTMKNVFLPGNTNQYVLQMTQAISNGVIRIRAETTDLVYLPSEIITAPITQNGTTVPPSTVGTTEGPTSITGLYFILGNATYQNEDSVPITDVGDGLKGEQALQCVTINVNTQCCRESDGGNIGEWHFPGGDIVPRNRDAQSADFTRNGGSQTVFLNRRNNALIPTGAYECRVPDSSGTTHVAIINLYDPSLSTTASPTSMTTPTPMTTPPMTSAPMTTAPMTTAPVTPTVITTEQPSPDVTVTSSTLIVGSMGTLSCTTDFTVDTIEWLDGSGVVRVRDNVTTMLNLTFTPINDAIGLQYTCRVTNDGQIFDKIFPINASIPSKPLSISLSHAGTSTAGSNFNLTCSINETIMGLTGMPAIIWMKNNEELDPSTDESLSSRIIRSQSSTVSILSFLPLLTSHAGVYTCTGSLSSPLRGAEIIPVVQSETVNVSIPTPMVTVKAPSNPVFSGMQITINCSLTIHDSVNMEDVTPHIRWRDRNGLDLSSTSPRITISPISNSGLIYSSSIAISPVGTDDTRFTCVGVIGPAASAQNIVESPQAETTVDLSIREYPPQQVSLTGEGTVTAGLGHTLTCSSSRDPGIPATFSLEWLAPNGNIVTNTDSTIQVIGDTSSNADTISSSLRFSVLRTSQAGMYSCRVHLTVPNSMIQHSVVMRATVTVKLAAPSSVVLSPGRTQDIYEGTPLNLTCITTINTAVIDTDINAVNTLINVQLSDRVMQSNAIRISASEFSVTIAYRVLVASLDGGDISCAVRLQPGQNSNNFITTSDEATSGVYNLVVANLPPPTVSISTPPLTMVGQPLTLTCTVSTIADNLVSPPTLQWTYPNGSTSISPSIPSGGVTTSTITFQPLMLSDGGQYQCTGRIRFTEFPVINDRINSTNVIIRVLIPPPQVEISNTQALFNGTNIALECRASLDPIINTLRVTVQGTWTKDSVDLSSNGGTISVSPTIQVPPYITELSFSPLRSNDRDGGLYVCMVEVTPQGNLFIAGSVGRATSDLTILPYPPFPVTVIPIRGSCDNRVTLRAGTSLLNNTANSRSFTYQWRGPDDSPITSTEGRFNVSQDGSLQIEQLSSEDDGNYVVSGCLMIPESDINGFCVSQQIFISRNVPGGVGSLMCLQQPSSSELNLVWMQPISNPTTVLEYSIKVLKYSQGVNREVTLNPLSPPFTQIVESGVFEVTVMEGLERFIPYQVSVTPRNLDGCGRTQSIDCFTQEGEPTISPSNITTERYNNTSILVTWRPLTLVEARGFIRYLIYYRKEDSRSTRQVMNGSSLVVDGSESSAVIGGLEEGTTYHVSMSTLTSSNTTGPVSPSVRVLPPPPPPPPTASSNTVVTIVVVVVVVVLLIALAISTVIIIWNRNFIKSKISKYERDLKGDAIYDVETDSIEMTDISHSKDSKSESFSLSDDWKQNEAIDLGVEITTEISDYTQSIDVASFKDHVLVQHRERDNGFQEEYQSLGSDPVNSYKTAKLPLNVVKNRYGNIFPYDHSRIILETLPSEECSDYINACTIDGYKKSCCYIAAQGPLKNTVSDFCRMVWEKQVQSIVMLTKCIEGGRAKCEQYWGENLGEEFLTPDKKFSIRTLLISQRADFIVRQLSLRKVSDDQQAPPRNLMHYHFISWPDHGVPQHAFALLNFIRYIQKCHKKTEDRPLLVHCSAGVGRTGTFITLDSMLERIEDVKTIAVHNFVKSMRQRRVLMVQTLSQYIFIHDALDDYITCGDTVINAPNLRAKVNLMRKTMPGKRQNPFDVQFQLLNSVSKQPSESSCSEALKPGNREKNRYPEIVPYDSSRLFLSSAQKYINASPMDGYRQRHAYIATQGPLPHTVKDFWTMVDQTKTEIVVLLCNMAEEEKESCYPFWPSKENTTVAYGGVSVSLQSTTSYDDFSVTTLLLEKGSAVVSNSNRRNLTLFHYLNWPKNGRPKTGTLLEMVEMVSKSQMSSSNNSPIIVVCNDGVSRTGTFITIHAQMERLKTEGCVDIFQFIKSARQQRPQIISDSECYALVHETLADFIDKFDSYANFKDVI